MGMILLLAVLGTSFISGILGMGGGMILMGILAIFLTVEKAMIFHGCAQFFSNGIRTWLYRKDICWRISGWYLIGALLASGIFLLLAWIPSKAFLFLALGAFPLLIQLPFWKIPSIESSFGSFLCGILVQFAQLMAGVSGPLLDSFYNTSQLSRYQIMGTKAFTQSLGHLSKVFFYGVLIQNSASLEDYKILFFLPFLTFLGAWGGKKVLERISDHQFRSIAFRTTQIIGMVFMAKGIGLLL